MSPRPSVLNPSIQLSSSAEGPCFPVPAWDIQSHGAERRGWEERSAPLRASMAKDGEHRTFPQ
jgi:hypothetical protein